MATAVSAMRQEKPHSLSYQLVTRTRVQSIRLVLMLLHDDHLAAGVVSQDSVGDWIGPFVDLLRVQPVDQRVTLGLQGSPDGSDTADLDQNVTGRNVA